MNGTDTSSSREVTLRDEQVERTRERILAAAVALLADDTLAELTIPLVAERAGVAVRTVYRYFPTKDALTDGIAELVDGRFGPTPFPQELAGVRTLARGLFQHFEENIELMRASRVSRGGRLVFARTRASRIASAERALAPLLEGASEEERRRAVAVIYALHSSATFLHYRDTMGMSAAEAAAAVEWAVGQLLDDLERSARRRRKAKG